jgi:hypothetical protein
MPVSNEVRARASNVLGLQAVKTAIPLRCRPLESGKRGRGKNQIERHPSPEDIIQEEKP